MHADGLRQIAAIAADAEGEDGTAPLDEAAWLALRHRADEVSAWVEEDDDALVALLCGVAAHVGQFLERRRAQIGVRCSSTSAVPSSMTKNS